MNNESSNRTRRRAERHLSQFAITIEYTLISVMVGVVIFPLMDFATPLLRELKFEFWLYILCGTLIVIDVWAAVIVHTLSIVGWPLDMVRNALYIMVAIIIAILMHFLSDPRSWFVTSVFVALFVVIIAWYDLGLLEQKRRAAHLPKAKILFEALTQRQHRTKWQGIGYLVLTLVAATFGMFAPAFFIEQHGHLLFIILQTLGTAYLLARTISVFITWSEPILQTVMEEMEAE